MVGKTQSGSLKYKRSKTVQCFKIGQGIKPCIKIILLICFPFFKIKNLLQIP